MEINTIISPLGAVGLVASLVLVAIWWFWPSIFSESEASLQDQSNKMLKQMDKNIAERKAARYKDSA